MDTLTLALVFCFAAAFTHHRISLAFLTLMAVGCGDAIPVRIHEDEPECVIEASMAAVDFWNAQIEGMFELTITDDTSAPLGAITIKTVGELDKNQLGHTSAHLARRVLKILDPGFCYATQENTIAHELAHAVRLRHWKGRKNKENLMYKGDPGIKRVGRELTDRQIKKAKRGWRLWFGRVF